MRLGFERSLRTNLGAVALVIATALTVGGGRAHAQASAASVIYAVYDSPSGAMNAFKALQQAHSDQVIRMESYAVVSKDARGKVRVQRSNQKTGTIAGVVVGTLIGALGGPAGAVAGATVGGLAGRATGEAVGIPTQQIKAMKDTLEPNMSAMIAVVDEQWVSDVSRSLQQTEARSVLQSKIEQNQIGNENSGGQSQPTNPQQPATSPMGTQPTTNQPPPQQR